jgi:hypothetical protein
MAWPTSLIQTESGGNWGALNNVPGAGGIVGHGGRLQFGGARLQDAANAGIIPVMSPQAFAQQPPEVQTAVENWHFADIDRQTERMGLNRYIGQTVGGVPITQDAIRAMAHLGGMGGVQAFLQSGGRENRADVNGTSLADYARIHGGSGGLLSGGGGADTMTGGAGGDRMAGLLAPQERQPSIWDRLEGVPVLGGLADPDRRARLAVGLGGMSLNPNAMLMASNMQGIDQRAQERETTQRMNQTIAYLQSVGRDDLVALVQAGMDPGSALQESARQPETAEPTSLMQNYDFLIAQGYTPEQALAAVQSGTIVNVGGEGGGAEVGTIPQGYAYVPDPNSPAGGVMVPIPGGPADPAATDAVAAGNADIATNTIITAAQRARDAAATRMITGPAAGVAGMIRNTDNAEIYRQVEVLKSNATIGNLQAMREASPTGGALGQVTAPELTLLQALSGALDPQSPNFLRDLDDYELTLLKIVHGPEKGQLIFEQTRPAETITTTTLPPTGQDIQTILDKYPAVP